MSDSVLKASTRQTLAYIEAYDVDLLRAIEAAFKDALHNCDNEAEEAEEAETLPPAESREPIPASRPAQQSPKVAAEPATTIELVALSNWHYRLPFVMLLIVTTLLLIFGRQGTL